MSTVVPPAAPGASTSRPRPLDEVVLATARLERQYRTGRSGYDDLAAPGWDQFVQSRERYLMSQGARGCDAASRR